jgi:hypothetical protein
MPPIPSMGLSELAILAGVTAMVFGVPLVGALVAIVVLLHRGGSYPVEQEFR